MIAKFVSYRIHNVPRSKVVLALLLTYINIDINS